MRIETIIKKFENRGYKIVRCMSGNITVTQPNGFSKVFDTFAAAHRYYFQ